MPSSSDELAGAKGVLHGKYELGRLLGQGTFAKVYHARDLQTNKSVAIKVVAKDKVVRAGMIEQIKREISAMKMMQNHSNIVRLAEVMATKSKIFIAMEYVRGGELFAKISKGKLSETLARHYFKQLIAAVDFCHRRGVYHRDLKPENLLLDEQGNLKITDFGLSAFADHLREDGLLHTTCGTPAYVAPEVIVKKGYDGAKADIWSCGVILFALLAGYLPFQDDNVVNLYKKIYRGDFKCPPWFSGESRRLITKMLDPNPKTRINAENIKQSPWFNKPLPRSLSASTVDYCDHSAKEKKEKTKKETETLNAFHIISMSEGLNLSRLFDGEGENDREMRFATARDVGGVISRLEELARVRNLRLKKKSDSWVRLQGQECRGGGGGGEGRLGIDADLFEVAPSLVVVEVRRSSGCTLEYNRFCSRELGPALMDGSAWPSSSMAQ